MKSEMPSEHDSLTVDHEMLLPVLQRSLGDPRMALGPVGAVAREEAQALVLPDNQHPVAIMLYFMNPVRPVGHLLATGSQAELVRDTHESADMHSHANLRIRNERASS
ncbi:hypothetical protein ACVMAJ_006871 [Bradyrhizobium sp. USDA 4448]